MATHSGTFVWRVPWTEGQDRLQSTESQRVGHNCAIDFHFHVQGVVSGTASPQVPPQLLLC